MEESCQLLLLMLFVLWLQLFSSRLLLRLLQSLLVTVLKTPTRGLQLLLLRLLLLLVLTTAINLLNNSSTILPNFKGLKC